MFIQMIASGCGMYAFSLFVTPLESEFGWTRAGVMMAFVAFNAGLAVTSPLVGRIVDRLQARLIIAAGAVVYGGSLWALSATTSLAYYSILWGLVGAGVSATSFVPLTAILFRWFRRRRGFAVGLMGVGIGAGGFVMAPFIGRWLLPTLGWRSSFGALGAIVVALLVPLSLAVIRCRPSDLGLAPDGLADQPVSGAGKAVAAAAARAPGREGGVTLREAMRTRSFWLLATCFALFGFAMNAVFQNQIPHLQDIGFPLAAASSAFSAVGVGSAIGKFAFGWICDWVRPRYVFVAGVILQLASVGLLSLVGADSSLGLVWSYALLYGLGIGCWPVMSMVVSSTFGLAHYGSLFGALNMIYMVGSMATPLVGHIRDVTGSYQGAFVIIAAMFVTIVPLVLLARPVASRTAT